MNPIPKSFGASLFEVAFPLILRSNSRFYLSKCEKNSWEQPGGNLLFEMLSQFCVYPDLIPNIHLRVDRHLCELFSSTFLASLCVMFVVESFEFLQRKSSGMNGPRKRASSKYTGEIADWILFLNKIEVEILEIASSWLFPLDWRWEEFPRRFHSKRIHRIFLLHLRLPLRSIR